MLWPLLAVL